MKKIELFSFLLIVNSITCFSQLERFEYTIKKKDLMEHVQVLASEDFEGRGTFSFGQQKSAKYISDFLKKCNIKCPLDKNSYYQKFSLSKYQSGTIQIKYDGKIVKNFDEIIYHGKSKSFSVTSDSLIFVGRGSDSDLNYQSIKNKSILVIGTSYLEKIIRLRDSLQYNAIFYFPNLSQKEYLTEFQQNKMFYIQACNINRFSADSFETHSLLKEKIDMVDNRVHIFQISPKIGSELMGITVDSVNIILANKLNTEDQLKNIACKNISYQIEINKREFSTENVYGFIEGTELPHKCIVLSAHYDHLGKKDSIVFYGADDNASGVASILEITEAFSIAKEKGIKPKVSLLFLLTSGEEMGLWGSKFFVNSSIFKKIEVIANINIDMIGRIDSLHCNNGNYIYVKGDSLMSKSLLQCFDNSDRNNSSVKTEVCKLSSSNIDLKNSDHASFLENNVPSVLITSGNHPDYHEPTDTYDKISYKYLQDRIKLIYRIINEIINAS